MTKDTRKLPSRKREMPATIGYVDEVRYELKSEIRALGHEMAAGFKQVDARFNENDSKFKSIDAQFKQVDARFDELKAEIQKVYQMTEETRAAFFRTQALMEQQHSENRLILERMAGLWERQDRVEHRMENHDEVMRELRSIARGRGKEN